MSLRLKLLLMSLLTLVLPWAGFQYAREMESVLREAERQSLVAVAETIAASLQGREDLLYRSAVAQELATPEPFDLQPLPLRSAPYLDGHADEWPGVSSGAGTGAVEYPPPPQEPPRNAADWKHFEHGGDRMSILTGIHERMFYALIEVRDDKLVFDAPNANPLNSAAVGDRIWLGFEDFSGAERQVFFAATGAGAVRARRIETRELGQQVAVEEPRIEGAWQPTPTGYRLELRVPLSMLGNRFGVLVDDRDERGALPASYGTLRGDDLRTRGRLVAASPELKSYLDQFLQPGLRMTVSTPTGGVLAMADRPALVTEPPAERGILAQLYRRLLERSNERRTLEIPASIYDRDRRNVIGTLQVTQDADRWLTLRDRPLTTLLNLTLFSTAIAVLATFGFAARLGLRLSRLRRASESALTREGLVTTFPETRAKDELGDVARSFSTLLQRLGEYTGYLRTLAGKLAHEIRTPLTIVRSSLENLETEGNVPSSARIYVERAREGSERLNAILVAMGAATRVEEAIQHAERTRFDLVPLLDSAVASYRIGFPERKFATRLPHEPVILDGAPDLIVQMLDKLIDNAVDFSPVGATITVGLRLEPHAAVLEVENPGPRLPTHARGRVFESLWQSRSGQDSRPHFGLGLYIVRLIAEFHGGRAEAEDLTHESGARFSVWLAR
jgi:two-component system sensor histidine kinase ChvG